MSEEQLPPPQAVSRSVQDHHTGVGGVLCRISNIGLILIIVPDLESNESLK